LYIHTCTYIYNKKPLLIFDIKSSCLIYNVTSFSLFHIHAILDSVIFVEGDYSEAILHNGLGNWPSRTPTPSKQGRTPTPSKQISLQAVRRREEKLVANLVNYYLFNLVA